MKLKKIVVFGGSGFLGRYLCKKLVKAKDIMVYNFDTKKFVINSKNYRYIKGNVLDRNKIKKIVTNSSIVINLSGMSDIEDCKKNPIDSAKINIIGNLNIIKCCIDKKIKKYLYASSLYAFSDQGSFYKCTKLASEVYLKEFSKIYDINYMVLRYGSLYGEGSNEKNGINRIFNSIINKNKILYSGNKNAIRSYVHAEDVAKATLKILRQKFDNSTIIIKGKKKTQIKALLKYIKKLFKLEQNIEYGKNLMVAHYIKSPKEFNIPKVKSFNVKELRSFENRLKDLMKYLTNKKLK